jgi:hypothetical protein
MKRRMVEVQMLHISLGSGWAVRDVWYVVSGRAYFPWERAA